MKTELSSFEIDQVYGGISFSRTSETTGWVSYNGQKYPFTDYNGLLSIAQQMFASGNPTDEELFNAFRAAGII